jgi:hypothetical protein
MEFTGFWEFPRVVTSGGVRLTLDEKASHQAKFGRFQAYAVAT